MLTHHRDAENTEKSKYRKSSQAQVMAVSLCKFHLCRFSENSVPAWCNFGPITPPGGHRKMDHSPKNSSAASRST